MLSLLRPTLVLLVVMTALLGAAYPLAVTGIAQLAFPHQANGSLVVRNSRVVGSELIGQNFTGPQWFHPRPSATTDADPAGLPVEFAIVTCRGTCRVTNSVNAGKSFTCRTGVHFGQKAGYSRSKRWTLA